MSIGSWAAAQPLAEACCPAHPSSTAVDRCVGRRSSAGRGADDSQKLAVALIRGVASIPVGRERAKECQARREEIVRGVESVLNTLETIEKALTAPGEKADDEPTLEPRHHLKCLRWAASMTNALQTAARTLETLDSYNTPVMEYLEIAEHLSIIKETLRDFTGVMQDLGEAAAREPKAPLIPPRLVVDKLDVLSETCSTVSGPRSGCVSEASSEADCDSPRRCPDTEETAQAFAEACAARAATPGEECGLPQRQPRAKRNSWWTAALLWS